MSDSYSAESRTEQPTARRLQKAREEGSVVRAHAVAGAAVLLAGAAVLVVGGTRAAEMLEAALRAGLTLDAEYMRDPERLLVAAGLICRPALSLLAPFLLLMMAVAFAADLAIGGWSLSTHPLIPDISRIDPVKGFGRLFSHTALAEIVKALGKFIVVGAVAIWLTRSRIPTFVHLASEGWPGAAGHVGALALDLFLVLAASLAFVSVLEVPYQLWSHRSRLKMTRQDLKDEQRDLDGSPQTRRRIRTIRLKLWRARMMREVPKSTVVITNPQHYAAALRYTDDGMRAPQLVAKGTGRIAARIRELAIESGVPIVEAPPLARAICRFVELGDEIPLGLYRAVAEVLAYVYRLRAARETGRPEPSPPQDGRFEPPPELVV